MKSLYRFLIFSVKESTVLAMAYTSLSYTDSTVNGTGGYSGTCDYMSVDYEEAVYSLLYTDMQNFIYRFILPTIFVVGVLNNSAFIYVVIRSKSMQTTTNTCLVNLAVADLIYITFSIVQRLWGFIYSPITPDDTSYGVIGCSMFTLVKSTSYFASLVLITLVSVERFYAVCRYQKKRNQRVYRNVIFITWAASFSLSLTFIPSVSNHLCYFMEWPDQPPFNELADVWVLCSPGKGWFTTYTDIVQTIPYVVLLLTNLCLYYNIIVGLNSAIKRAMLTGKRLKNTQLRNQVAWMLIINGVLFFILLLPQELSFLIKIIIENYANTSGLWRNLTEIMSLLTYINSSINPIVYSVMSSRYRKAFQDAFMREKCQRRETDYCTNTEYIQPSAINQEESFVSNRNNTKLNTIAKQPKSNHV